jgi:hypothetical protein
MNPTHIKVKHLNLDLDLLKRDARRINTKVIKEYGTREIPANATYQSVLADQLQEAPMSSKLHDFYNVFSFPYDGINQLYREISSFFKEVNTYDEPYYIHGWLNYQTKGQSIPWHHHWKGLSGLDQTYVCSAYINAEPSVTTYKFDNGYINAKQNINNTITLYEDVGDIHMVDIWHQDEPRISISMDMVPMKYIQGSKFLLNTWIPLV